jgi:hypothetical protein
MAGEGIPESRGDPAERTELRSWFQKSARRSAFFRSAAALASKGIGNPIRRTERLLQIDKSSLHQLKDDCRLPRVQFSNNVTSKYLRGNNPGSSPIRSKISGGNINRGPRRRTTRRTYRFLTVVLLSCSPALLGFADSTWTGLRDRYPLRHKLPADIRHEAGSEMYSVVCPQRFKVRSMVGKSRLHPRTSAASRGICGAECRSHRHNAQRHDPSHFNQSRCSARN